MKNKKGYTLIELIVTFGLIAIFLTTATMTVSTCMRIFYRIKNMSQAQIVADTLLETISSQLAFAALANFEGSDGTSNAMEISADNGSIAYVDKTHTPVIMTRDDDHKLHLSDQEQKESGNGSAEWYYGKGMYVGMEIEELNFEHVSENFIKVSLSLKNPKSGHRLSTSKWIECYNLKAGDIVTQE